MRGKVWIERGEPGKLRKRTGSQELLCNSVSFRLLTNRERGRPGTMKAKKKRNKKFFIAGTYNAVGIIHHEERRTVAVPGPRRLDKMG